MRRRIDPLQALCLEALVGLFIVGQTTFAAAPAKPNVLVILADDKYKRGEKLGNSSRKSPQFSGEPTEKQIPADTGQLRPIPEN
jgi:hypothetical protein